MTSNEEKCGNCGGGMYLKSGRFGIFLACSSCSASRPVNDQSTMQVVTKKLRGGQKKRSLVPAAAVVLEMETACTFRIHVTRENLDSEVEQVLENPELPKPLHWEPREDGKNGPVYSISDYEAIEKSLRKRFEQQQEQQQEQQKPDENNHDNKKREFAFVDGIPLETRIFFQTFMKEEGGLEEKEKDDEAKRERRMNREKEWLHEQLPSSILEAILPFQEGGVLFALRKRCRCLIADEMGLGKTLQALGVVAAAGDEWPVLVICPASLRLVWAEECERWLNSFLRPENIHVVFGSDDKLSAVDTAAATAAGAGKRLKRRQKSGKRIPFLENKGELLNEKSPAAAPKEKEKKEPVITIDDDDDDDSNSNSDSSSSDEGGNLIRTSSATILANWVGEITAASATGGEGARIAAKENSFSFPLAEEEKKGGGAAASSSSSGTVERSVKSSGDDDDVVVLEENFSSAFMLKREKSGNDSDNRRLRRVCIVSYRMLVVLEEHLKQVPWRMVIVDESHTLRATPRMAESQQTKAAVRFITNAPCAILLSGTPSLSRPFDLFHQVDSLFPLLIGRDKLDFARRYCCVQYAPHFEPRQCRRDHELNLLLRKSVMIRRLKSQVMTELPAKRRQVVYVDLMLPTEEQRQQMDKKNSSRAAEGTVGGGASAASAAAKTKGHSDVVVCITSESSGEENINNDNNNNDDDENNDTTTAAACSVAENLKKRPPFAMRHRKRSKQHIDDKSTVVGESVFSSPFFNSSREEARGKDDYINVIESSDGDGGGASSSFAVSPVTSPRSSSSRNNNNNDNNQSLARAAPIHLSDDSKSISSFQDNSRDGFNTSQELSLSQKRKSPFSFMFAATTSGGLPPPAASSPSSSRGKLGLRGVGKVIRLSQERDVSGFAIPTFADDAEGKGERIEPLQDSRHSEPDLTSVATTYQRAGLSKLPAAISWMRATVVFGWDGKFVVFAHHKKVLDGVEQALKADNVGCIRLEGDTPPRTRVDLVHTFSEDPSIRCALVSITAGGQGLDLSAASVAIFYELPPDVGWVRQAEDRLHRRGQQSSVLIYYLLGRSRADGDEDDELEAFDERRWTNLSASLEAATAVSDGPASAVDLRVDAVSDGTFASQVDVRTRPNEAAKTNPEPSVVLSEQEGIIDEAFPQVFFELSKHTGRFHLHSSESGTDLLGASFRWVAVLAAQKEIRETGRCPINASISSRISKSSQLSSLALECALQMQELAPRDRRKLGNRIVALPLTDALERIRKGSRLPGSYRRYTPRHELVSVEDGCPHVDVLVRCGPHGQGSTTVVQWPCSNEGDPMCLMCRTVISSKFFNQALKQSERGEPIAHHELFCSGDCVRSYALRVTPGALRRALREEESGVCVECGLDCRVMVEKLKQLPTAASREALLVETYPNFANRVTAPMMRQLCEHPIEGHAWHADHIVAVSEGGGEVSDLDNMRTLCVACHLTASREQATSRKIARKKGK